MSFGRVSNTVAYSAMLTLEAKGLYAILCSLCGSKNFCYPSLQTLSDLSGKSKSTVQRLLRELADKGVITRGFDGSLNKTVTVNNMDPKSKTIQPNGN